MDGWIAIDHSIWGDGGNERSWVRIPKTLKSYDCDAI
jgi:hypothetical protein